MQCKSDKQNGIQGVYITTLFDFKLTSEHNSFTYKVEGDTNNVVERCSIENIAVVGG